MRILLVEDDPGHARLIERNLRRAGVTHNLTILPDGEAALAYLDRELGESGSLHAAPLLILTFAPGFVGTEGQFALAVPDHRGFAPRHQLERVRHVALAVRSGENDDGGFHLASCG